MSIFKLFKSCQTTCPASRRPAEDVKREVVCENWSTVEVPANSLPVAQEVKATDWSQHLADITRVLDTGAVASVEQHGRGSDFDGERYFSTAEIPIFVDTPVATAVSIPDPAVPAGLSIATAIGQLRSHHKAACYIPAAKLVHQIEAQIKTEYKSRSRNSTSTSTSTSEEWHSEELQCIARECKERSVIVEETMQKGFDGEEGWILAKESKSSKTYYQIDSDTGMLHLKLDGVVHGNMIDCICVWKEASLYKQWLPLMTQSDLIHNFSDTELIVKAYCGLLGIGREMLLHGWADCSGLEENESFIVLCDSVVPDDTDTDNDNDTDNHNNDDDDDSNNNNNNNTNISTSNNCSKKTQKQKKQKQKHKHTPTFRGIEMPTESYWTTRANVKKLQLLVQHMGKDPSSGKDRFVS